MINYENLNEVFEYLQPECVAIYRTGSIVLKDLLPQDFKFGDKDVLLYCKTKKDYYRIITKLRNHHEYDWLVRVVGYYPMRSNIYFERYRDYVCGEQVDIDIDILGKDKNEYLTELKLDIEELNNYLIKFPRCRQKIWYQILIGIDFLINNSYTLTEDQFADIVEAHDAYDKEEPVSERIRMWCKNTVDDLIATLENN